MERGGDSTSDHEDEQNGADEYSSGQIFGAGSEIHESQAGNINSASVSNKNRNVEDLEMLLGAYFVQIGGTVNKLSAVCIHSSFILTRYISHLLSVCLDT